MCCICSYLMRAQIAPTITFCYQPRKQNLRIPIIALFLLLLLCTLPNQGYGQTGTSKEYSALVATEAEFKQLTRDMTQTLRAMPDKQGGQYTCIASMMQKALAIDTALTYYKFSVAIKDLLTDDEDLRRTATVMKVQTDLLRNETGIYRDEFNGLIGVCSRSPLAVAKGQAILSTISRIDDILRSIADQLLWKFGTSP